MLLPVCRGARGVRGQVTCTKPAAAMSHAPGESRAKCNVKVVLSAGIALAYSRQAPNCFAINGTPPLTNALPPHPPLAHRLMPGHDVAAVLVSNPDIMLALQRGARSLGPGAEF
jgi:hypothetical protein